MPMPRPFGLSERLFHLPSSLLVCFGGDRISSGHSEAHLKSRMTGWPPKTVGEVVWYATSLGIAYAALTAAREAFRERPPPRQRR